MSDSERDDRSRAAGRPPCSMQVLRCVAELAVGRAQAFQLAAHHVGELRRLELVELGGDPGQPARAESFAPLQQA
ncbi:hypothetical protein D3C80_2112970 [compost metagenome]